MNGPAALAAARAAGAVIRLRDGKPTAVGLDKLPTELAETLRVHSAWVADCLAAEQVAASPLKWMRHGPGWLTVLHPDAKGDGQRLLVGPIGRRWRLTTSDHGQHPRVLVAGGTLDEVLTRAGAV